MVPPSLSFTPQLEYLGFNLVRQDKPDRSCLMKGRTMVAAWNRPSEQGGVNPSQES
jgi:hypothetical protein